MCRVLVDLIGVERTHHVGMVACGRQASSHAETERQLARLTDLGDDLGAYQSIVHGALMTAHRSRADAVEYDIPADDQALGPVTQKSFRLKGVRRLSRTRRSASAAESRG